MPCKIIHIILLKDELETNLLSAGIMMNIVAYFSDKYHQRGLGIIFQAMLCIIGLPIMGFAHSPAVRYFGVFLATAGCNGNVPLVLTYQANNIRGQWVSLKPFSLASL